MPACDSGVAFFRDSNSGRHRYAQGQTELLITCSLVSLKPCRSIPCLLSRSTCQHEKGNRSLEEKASSAFMPAAAAQCLLNNAKSLSQLYLRPSSLKSQKCSVATFSLLLATSASGGPNVLTVVQTRSTLRDLLHLQVLVHLQHGDDEQAHLRARDISSDRSVGTLAHISLAKTCTPYFTESHRRAAVTPA